MHRQVEMGGNGQRAGVTWAVLAMVAGIQALSAILPASAHTNTWTGTLNGPGFYVQSTQPDFWAYQAGDCHDRTDGMQSAVINAIPWRGHRLTARITNATLGQKFSVFIGTAACKSPDAFNATPGTAGGGTSSVVFVVPNNATYIIVMNASDFPPYGDLNLTYRIDACHPAPVGWSC